MDEPLPSKTGHEKKKKGYREGGRKGKWGGVLNTSRLGKMKQRGTNLLLHLRKRQKVSDTGKRRTAKNPLELKNTQGATGVVPTSGKTGRGNQKHHRRK